MTNFFRYRDVLYCALVVALIYCIFNGLGAMATILSAPILCKLFIFVIDYEDVMSKIRNNDDEKSG